MSVKNEKIEVKPNILKKGDKACINYKGSLTENGAGKIYMHYGYDGWNNISDIPMKRQEDGSFKAEVKAVGRDEIDLCFKDDKNCWDNNNGADFRVPIE